MRMRMCSAVVLLFALGLGTSVAPADAIYSTGFEAEAFDLGHVKNQDGWQGAPLPYISDAEPHSGEQSVQMDGRDLVRFTPDSVVFTVSWRPFAFEEPTVDVCVDARLDGPSTDMGNGPADDLVSANLYVYSSNDRHGTIILSSAENAWTRSYRFEAPASLGQYHNLAIRIDPESESSEYFFDGIPLGTQDIGSELPTFVEFGLFALGDGSVDLTQYTAYFDNFQITPDGCVPALPGLLQAGDADQDFDFDQLDIVQVQIGGKYLTGQPATWGEGDWDGAPGGKPGIPPEGNGLFDQLDIIAALASGLYLTGPYNEPAQNGAGGAQAALAERGVQADEQTSIVYDASTGELSVDAPLGVELSSINIDSAASIFTGEAAQNLGGSFDNDADNNVFKAMFGGSFGSFSFGNVAQVALSQSFVINDLTVVGSLAEGGELGDVDLIYFPVPEPTGAGLFGLGVLAISAYVRTSRHRSRSLRLILIALTGFYGADTGAHADLIGYWPLNGDTTDRSISGIDGFLEGDIAYTDDVPPLLDSGLSVLLNQGAGPDAAPGRVDLGNPDILNFSDNDWTISAWMKTPDGLSTRGNIFSNGGDNAGGIRYVLAFLEFRDFPVVLTVDNNIIKWQAFGDRSFVVNDEQWHHLVGLREGSEIRVYIDGELAAKEFRLGEDYNLSGTEQQNAYIGIGIGQNNDLFEKSFIGWIDDVAVFDEALSEEQILSVMRGDYGPWGISDVVAALQAGDADQDGDFDQLDLVQVQIAGRYLTGQAATWGEGDWDAAPGGEPGSPPEGNGLFDQLDIIAALGAGFYLTGPYNASAQNAAGGAQAALAGLGMAADGQASIVYHAATGELSIDAPVSFELSSINIDSVAGIFTGEAAQNLGGSFDNDTDNNMFKATFGGSFGSLSFGNVAQAGLSQSFVVNDLTVVGSLAGGGPLGDVDLIYVPEPSAHVLLLFGLLVVATKCSTCKVL